MFVTAETALRIERAEAEVARAVVAAGRDAFWAALGTGAASFVRPGSPLNKVIGAGIDAALDLAQLARVEAELQSRGEPVRVELATLARVEVGDVLAARGYRLLGFENVLVRPLAAQTTPARADVRVERVTRTTEELWQSTVVAATIRSDETGVPVDDFSRATITDAIADMLAASGFDRYLAYLDGAPVGAASMFVHAGVALFTGSATLPDARRRGVQSALIATRMANAQVRGAVLAAVTTAPGSQSQANVMRHGFALAYARAILSAAAALAPAPSRACRPSDR